MNLSLMILLVGFFVACIYQLFFKRKYPIFKYEGGE